MAAEITLAAALGLALLLGETLPSFSILLTGDDGVLEGTKGATPDLRFAALNEASSACLKARYAMSSSISRFMAAR